MADPKLPLTSKPLISGIVQRSNRNVDFSSFTNTYSVSGHHITVDNLNNLLMKMTGKNFTPFPVLQTERLTLRQLRSSDATEIFALRSNDNVNKYLNRKRSQSIDDAKKFIQAIHENIQRNDSIYWAITLNGTDKLIGTSCLFNFSEDYSKVEIGYELLPDFQGKGIMQEAILKVIHFGFQQVGINSIEASTHSENQRSTRLLEKLNFKRDGAVDENLVFYKLTHNG